jgi:hypothetical protein
MKQNTFNNQKGAAVTLLVIGIGALGLLLSGARVGEVAYEKIQTDVIADQLQEQAQYLAEQAPSLGKSGDLAVNESLRLNEASKKIRDTGLRTYSEKMIDEAVGLGTGLAIGKTIELAGKTGEVVNLMRDIKAIGEEGISAYRYSEADMQVWETIKGSRDNVDDFELARYKAEIDEVARMKGIIEESGEEIQTLITRQEQADQYWEELKAKQEQRKQDRLKALNNQDVREELRHIIISNNTQKEDFPGSTDSNPEGQGSGNDFIPSYDAGGTPIEEIQSDYMACSQECMDACAVKIENCIKSCVADELAKAAAYCADEMNEIRLRDYCRYGDLDEAICFNEEWNKRCDKEKLTEFHTKWCTLGCQNNKESTSCYMECNEKCHGL